MKILIAHDEAFNFVYRANIDWLRERGEVGFFSPLHDDCKKVIASLAHHDTLLYLPGGYPELFAKELAANVNMRQTIWQYAEDGGKIFAECGGFMYLCKSIDETDMCGVLPLKATMQGARLHLGYRQMEWGRQIIKGHEFHYSTVTDDGAPDHMQVWRLQKTASGCAVDTPMYRYRNVVAGYTHWYWADQNEFDLFGI